MQEILTDTDHTIIKIIMASKMAFQNPYLHVMLGPVMHTLIRHAHVYIHPMHGHICVTTGTTGIMNCC